MGTCSSTNYIILYNMHTHTYCSIVLYCIVDIVIDTAVDDIILLYYRYYRHAAGCTIL